MTCDLADGGAPVKISIQSRPAKASTQAEDPSKTLDALAVEVGRLAAQRDFAKVVEDEADTDLSSPEGSVAS